MIDTLKRGAISTVSVVESPERALKRVFGFDSFRVGQKQIIENVVAGRDSFLVAPTGLGKTLAYQLPAICLDGTAIVISPLIALMKDQVDALKKRGVPATFINSSVSDAIVQKRMIDMSRGVYKVVYIAPERVNSSVFMKAIKSTSVSLVAIDEAHAISSWGHDFRPSYRKIPKLLEAMQKKVPIVATTATATPIVRDDIVTLLKMDDPFILCTGFRRDNLHLSIDSVPSSLEAAKRYISCRESNESTIVYLGTKKNVVEMCSAIKQTGVKATYYHGGMTPEDREKAQNAFMSGKVPVICATNAFGMGIDKSDIRCVIHATMPGSVEAYYQEVGRAGRDGKDSDCAMFVDAKCIELQEYFVKSSNPSSRVAELTYSFLMDEFSRCGSRLDRTYDVMAKKFFGIHGWGCASKAEVSSVLTFLKKRGVFTQPKRGILKLSAGHNPPDFSRCDKNRETAMQRLREMLSFITEEDIHQAILDYFGAEA